MDDCAAGDWLMPDFLGVMVVSHFPPEHGGHLADASCLDDRRFTRLDEEPQYTFETSVDQAMMSRASAPIGRLMLSNPSMLNRAAAQSIRTRQVLESMLAVFHVTWEASAKRVCCGIVMV